MGISSAMNASIMGLSVNSSKLAAISDNIANSGTKGYKRADMEFSSLVTSESASSYDAGGVRGASVRDIDRRGALLSTTNVGDLAIAGDGFLPVTDLAAVDNQAGQFPLKLLTTGSFRPNADGYLTNASGLTLMGWAAGQDGTVTAPNRESAAGLEPIRIASLAISADPTTTVDVALNLPASETLATATPMNGVTAPTITLPVEYFTIMGGSEQLALEFTNSWDNAGTPTLLGANTWRMMVKDETGATVQLLDLEFDGSVGNGGKLLNVTEPAATTAPASATAPATSVYDPVTGQLNVTMSSAQPITFNIGAPNSNQNLQQLDTGFLPIAVTKNGSQASPMTGFEINENGTLDAVFESGFRKTLYQIPVGMVPNARGLKALDAQAFSTSTDSGSIYFFDAGDGPTGGMVSFALEESTTDISEELTQLIKTQRAYSTNAKVIQTVDEMLQETTNLKR